MYVLFFLHSTRLRVAMIKLHWRCAFFRPNPHTRERESSYSSSSSSPVVGKLDFGWFERRRRRKKNVLKRIAFRAAPYGAACLAHFTWHFFWVSGTLPSYSFFFFLGLSLQTQSVTIFPLQKKLCFVLPSSEINKKRTSKYIGDDTIGRKKNQTVLFLTRLCVGNKTQLVDSFV